jgi:hypothetical protein
MIAAGLDSSLLVGDRATLKACDDIRSASCAMC